MARSATDYRGVLQALLPSGRVWAVAPGSRREALLTDLAQLWARIDAAAANLEGVLPGSDPDLLSDWEATLGLTAADQNLSTAQRTAQIQSRFVGNGGQSRAFLISYAAALGFTITIKNFAPFRAGMNAAGDPVRSDKWIYALSITIQADANGFGSAYLFSALGQIIAAHIVLLQN